RIYTRRARYWDRIDQTAYRGAELVAAAVRAQKPQGDLRVLDAGCGTGMVGGLLRDRAAGLDGVDLSADMLEKAREKGLYDRLHLGDLLLFMTDHPATYDVVVSAATLIHFGDLSRLFLAVARTLRPGGCFVFTLFPDEGDPEGDGVVINPLEGFERGGCYAHGRGHVVRTATGAGLVVAGLAREIHEYVQGEPVCCFVGVVVKP
ncbi:MAG: methyltransferase domain-containing protein, partial [Magnetococcales bacterium]|nr:methyltransferase domain-containing protein [Magnetococcales bacterium]